MHSWKKKKQEGASEVKWPLLSQKSNAISRPRPSEQLRMPFGFSADSERVHFECQGQR